MERYTVFGEFTYSLALASCSGTLKRALGRLLQNLGFEFFLYKVQPSGTGPASHSGQDMVLANAAMPLVISGLGFSAEEDDRGITVCLDSRHGESAALHCAAPCGVVLDLDQRAALAPMLELAGNHFHAKALNILVRERLAAQAALQRVSLSPREREVLYWASVGKTCWETGAILGISQKSVEAHAEHAKTKLGAANKTHAVARAMICGMIPDQRAANDFAQLVWRLGITDKPLSVMRET